MSGLQGYQWLKEKVQSEDGKKQQAKVMDLLPMAHQLGCTVAQLAIGKTARKFHSSSWLGRHLSQETFSSFSLSLLLVPAWCLRSEGVSSVLLGVSSAEQLVEHLGALQVSWGEQIAGLQESS